MRSLLGSLVLGVGVLGLSLATPAPVQAQFRGSVYSRGYYGRGYYGRNYYNRGFYNRGYGYFGGYPAYNNRYGMYGGRRSYSPYDYSGGYAPWTYGLRRSPRFNTAPGYFW